MQQIRLPDTGTLERNPLCLYTQYQPSCSRYALIGEPEVLEGCVNYAITCPRCPARGVRSVKTETRD